MTENVTGLRIVADYQMFGDLPGKEWGRLVFTDAEDKGLITGYEILGSFPGGGVDLVIFTVDVPLGTRFDPAMTHREARKAATDFLNREVIHDSDVEVRQVMGIDLDVRGCSCGMADYGAPGHDGDTNEDPC